MKLRITYRKQAANINISVDTDIDNQQLYSKEFDKEETALKSVDNILKAAKVDRKMLKTPIEFKDEFGSFIFDVKLDFSKEEEYKQFVESVFKKELIKYLCK